MYRIIGADQKEYGPVSAEDLRKWIAEGRVNAQTRAWSAGMNEWRALGTFPEFSAAFPAPYYAPAQYTPYYGTNGMAVAGFIFSLLGVPCCCCAFFPLLGFIFSLIGIAQTGKNSSQGGRTLAVVGLVISLLTLIMLLIFWITGSIAGTLNLNNQSFHI